MLLRFINKIKRNKTRVFLAVSTVLFVVLFTNLPLGFSNIIHASQIVRIDENGTTFYKSTLNEEEVEYQNDYSESKSDEPTEFETIISRKINAFNPDDTLLILVNKDNPLTEDVECELVDYCGFDVDVRIYDSLKCMFDDALKDGVRLSMASGYRNYNTQKYLYDKKIGYFKRLGYSQAEAENEASRRVTPPLTSEHETGLAVDILSENYKSMDSDFGNTDAGIWLKEHCFEYGFILRYPEGKEDITRIQYEPWHFRYVGKDAAEFIYINNLTFEEFIEMVKENQ